MPASVTMRHGAVAIVDVLGFKGIWRRFPEETVIRSMQALLEETQQKAREQAQAAPRWDNMIDFISPVFLSDTVVFGLAPRPPDEVNREIEASGEMLDPFDSERLGSWTVWHMGNLIADLMRRALVGEVPFAFRGAIAFGRFGMTERFVIGEAVDEAADYHERADGAFVGLAPSAAQYEQAPVPSAASKFVKYDIPVKPKGTMPGPPWTTWAVVPWGDLNEPELDLVDRYSRTLASSEPALVEEVDRKRANTLAFLQFAVDASMAPLRAMRADMDQRMAALLGRNT
jgi:hypothetical protein